jgi:hypothetical protein
MVHWLLAIDALATAITVMLSGYYRAGLLGVGLAGSIAGATLASYIAFTQSPTTGSLAMSLIGIFSVILMGHYFGALSTSLALGLLVAPLLAWTPELPRLRNLPPAWRVAGRFLCVIVPLTMVVIIARREFSAASTGRPRPAASNERAN